MNHREDEKYGRWHGYLFTLMMLDFFLTYIGIRFYGVIVEANPFLQWAFELPFLSALLLRILFSGIVVFLSSYLRMMEYRYHHQFILFALLANCLVMLMHFRWVIHLVQSYIPL